MVRRNNHYVIALLFTVLLKFNFCLHWQMSSMLILRLLHVEKAKYMQRSHVCELIMWLTNRFNNSHSLLSSWWNSPEVCSEWEREVTGIWIKKEERNGSGDQCTWWRHDRGWLIIFQSQIIPREYVCMIKAF